MDSILALRCYQHPPLCKIDALALLLIDIEHIFKGNIDDLDCLWHKTEYLRTQGSTKKVIHSCKYP